MTRRSLRARRDPSRRRVPGTGNLSRFLAGLILSVYALAAGIGIVGRAPSTASVLILIAIGVLLGLVVVRSAFLGVWVTDAAVVAVEWWRTEVFPIHTVCTVEPVEFTGMFDPFGSPFLCSIALLTTERGQCVVGGSVARSGAAATQCETIRGYCDEVKRRDL